MCVKAMEWTREALVAAGFDIAQDPQGKISWHMAMTRLHGQDYRKRFCEVCKAMKDEELAERACCKARICEGDQCLCQQTLCQCGQPVGAGGESVCPLCMGQSCAYCVVLVEAGRLPGCGRC